MKKKAPKIKKKIPGYLAGGTTLAYQTGEANKVDETIYKPKQLGKGTFKQQLGDFGRGTAETLAGFASVDLDPKYKTGGGQKYGRIQDNYIAPISGVAGSMLLNSVLPGAGTAMKTIGSVGSDMMEAKKTKRLPNETDSQYSKRMAALGIDVTQMAEDEVTQMAMTSVANAGGEFVGSLLEGEGKAEGGEVKESKKKGTPQYEATKKLIKEDFIITDQSWNKDTTKKRTAAVPHMQRRGLQKIGIGIRPNNSVQKKADGGEIDGPGTGKSDSIPAKVKPGSFVVPVENAHIAKMLDEKFFGKEDKAKLNQPGGAPVKLSDGEYLFTPEKKKYLATVAGIDLNALAPNAKKGNSKAAGGSVGDDLSDIDTIVAQAKEDKKKATSEAERVKAQRRIDELLKQKETFKKTADVLRKYLADEKETFEVSQFLGEVPEGEDPVEFRKNQYQNSLNQYRNDLSKQGYKGVNKTTDISTGKGGKKSVAKALVEGDTSSSKTTEPEYDFMSDVEKTNAEKILVAIPKQGEDLDTNKTETSGEYTSVIPDTAGSKKRSYDITSGLDLGLGIAQTAIAAKALLSDGPRPVDKLSGEYLGTIQSARDQAAFGFTDAEKTMAEQDIESNRRASVEVATNMGGGNFATSMANSRAAGNIASRNLVELAAADNTLKLQKQRYRDSLIIDKVEKDRRLFEDKLKAFNINQEAGAQMLNAGIQSIQNSASNRRAQKLTESLKTE